MYRGIEVTYGSVLFENVNEKLGMVHGGYLCCVLDTTPCIGTFMVARAEAKGSILEHFIVYSTK